MTEQVHPSLVLSDKLFRRLKSLTQENFHGEAYQEAARALKLPELEAEFARINEIRDRAGELSYEMNQKRNAAYQQLILKSRSILSAEQAKKLNMCF